jgi:PhnB protein
MSERWSLAPYLRTQNAAKAIEWYVRALGATERERYEMPDGTIGHAELDLHGNRLCLADTSRANESERPKTYQDVPVLLYASVPDTDAAYRRAIEAGAAPERPPADQPYGERSAGFIDPFGHVWYFSTPVATLQQNGSG